MENYGPLIKDVQYESHENIAGSADPPVYKVCVTMTGHQLNGHTESIRGEIFVQECASDRPDDLLRCAMRQFGKLSADAMRYAKLRPEVARAPSRLVEARRGRR